MWKQIPKLLLVVAIGQILIGLGIIILDIFFSHILSFSSADVRNALLFLVVITVCICIAAVICGIGLLWKKSWAWGGSIFFYFFHLLGHIQGFIQNRFMESSFSSSQRNHVGWIFILAGIIWYLVLNEEVQAFFKIDAKQKWLLSTIALVLAIGVILFTEAVMKN